MACLVCLVSSADDQSKISKMRSENESGLGLGLSPETNASSRASSHESFVSLPEFFFRK